MGFFDAIFGRQKPAAMGPERLFAMSTAQLTLETDQGLTPSGSAGICFRAITSGPFQQLEQQITEIAKIAAKDEQLGVRQFQDNVGYTWYVFTSADFQELVTAIHMVAQNLVDQGYSTQLLFAIFPFTRSDKREIYWLYNFKRGTFYPFVPTVDTHDRQRRRDNAEEMRLGTAIGKELPVESQYEYWYPVWDLDI
ncbi:MAG TPA: hypothetical protein VF807_00185 [Ktedonobacterales bacterium]